MCRISGNDRPTPVMATGLPEEPRPHASRRAVLSAVAASAAAAAPLLTATQAAAATPATGAGAPLSLVLLGTSGGPPPLANRYGISSALVVNGRTYVVDCGRGAVTQYLRAGLSLPSLAGIFLTHLHADHIVDYYSFPLLCAGAAGAQGFRTPVSVYGPGPAGISSTVDGAPGPVPGTVDMTRLAGAAYAASPTFFMTEHAGIDPATLLDVHDVLPPSAVGASAANTAPVMRPFTVMETDDVKVTAVLVPHGAVFPAYAYRFDTDHGSVVFSGDTSPPPTSSVWHGARTSWCTKPSIPTAWPGWACRRPLSTTSCPHTPTWQNSARSPPRQAPEHWWPPISARAILPPCPTRPGDTCSATARGGPVTAAAWCWAATCSASPYGEAGATRSRPDTSQARRGLRLAKERSRTVHRRSRTRPRRSWSACSPGGHLT